MAYQSIHTGSDIDHGITNIKQIFNLIYPVGSYYMSSSATNPGTLFGGTWGQITDRMIMAAGSTYAVGTTGGSATHTHTTAGHTLTVAEIPSHTHNGLYWGRPDDAAWAVSLNPGTYAYRLQWYGQGGTTTAGAGLPDTDWRVGETGGGFSHSHGNTGSSSNLPPYIVAYIWRRTA